jgi:ethanolamine permease
MYCISMISLFKLRKDPSHQPSFKTPLFPWFPGVALILSVVSLVAIIYYNITLSLIFFAGLLIVYVVFILTGKRKALAANTPL